MNYRTKDHSNWENSGQQKLNPECSILHCLWWVNFASAVLRATTPGQTCLLSCSKEPRAHVMRTAPKPTADFDLVKPLWDTPNHRNYIACLTETFCFSLVNWLLTTQAEQKACPWRTLSLLIPSPPPPLHGAFISCRAIHVRPWVGEHFSYFFPLLLSCWQKVRLKNTKVSGTGRQQGSRKKSEGPRFRLSRVSWFKSI